MLRSQTKHMPSCLSAARCCTHSMRCRLRRNTHACPPSWLLLSANTRTHAQQLLHNATTGMPQLPPFTATTGVPQLPPLTATTGVPQLPPLTATTRMPPPPPLTATTRMPQLRDTHVLHQHSMLHLPACCDTHTPTCPVSYQAPAPSSLPRHTPSALHPSPTPGSDACKRWC